MQSGLFVAICRFVTFVDLNCYSMQKYLPALLFTGAIVINIITWLVLWHYSPLTGSSTPLHYNVVTGFDEVGSRGLVYLLPIFGLCILICNGVVAFLLRRLGPYPASVCGASAALVSVFLLLAAVLLRVQAG
jgi:hypothetical protein